MLSTTVNRSITSWPLLTVSEVQLRNPGTRCIVKKLFHSIHVRFERVSEMFSKWSGSDCAPAVKFFSFVFFWSIVLSILSWDTKRIHGSRTSRTGWCRRPKMRMQEPRIDIFPGSFPGPSSLAP